MESKGHFEAGRVVVSNIILDDSFWMMINPYLKNGGFGNQPIKKGGSWTSRGCIHVSNYSMIFLQINLDLPTSDASKIKHSFQINGGVFNGDLQLVQSGKITQKNKSKSSKQA